MTDTLMDLNKAIVVLKEQGLTQPAQLLERRVRAIEASYLADRPVASNEWLIQRLRTDEAQLSKFKSSSRLGWAGSLAAKGITNEIENIKKQLNMRGIFDL